MSRAPRALFLLESLHKEILPRTIAYKCLGTDFFQRRRTERLPLMLGLI